MEMKSSNNKGITLIALVITIIVLMILTGVAIALITGEEGILSRANESTIRYGEKQEEENGIIKSYEDIYDRYESGKIAALPSGWDSSKVTPVYDTESKDYVVPIPKDFYYVGGTRDTGIVISDNVADKDKGDSHEVAQTLEGNQFVWIPIDNIDEIYDSNKKQGKDYMFTAEGKAVESGTYTIRYVTGDWPGAVYLDSDPANLQEAGSTATTKEQFRDELQEGLDKSISSIARYKGYYVGRYETGNLSQSKVVVKAKNTDIIKGWYTKYRLQKEMYKDKASVNTVMINGCHWDGMLKFINTNNSIYGNFIYNNRYTGTGNHTGTKVPTGSKATYKTNNIYDIDGNAAEATTTRAGSEHNGSFGESGEAPQNLRAISEEGSRIVMHIAE